MDRASMKAHAKEMIEGKIFMLFAIAIIISAATSAIGMILGPFAGLMALVITGPITFAEAFIYLGVTKKSRMPRIEDCIVGFVGENFTHSFIGYLRYVVFTLLWSLLLIIPGIIKAISYSQMFYLMVDDKDLDPADAQAQSMALMEGHKQEYFILLLSFIPWYLLGILTLGIGFIWILPYVSTTLAEYHVRLVDGNKTYKKEAKAAVAEAKKNMTATEKELEKATKDMKKAAGEVGKTVKKKTNEVLANVAESIEKSAKEAKKQAKKDSK